MYRSIDDFVNDYLLESINTLKLLQGIDPQKLSLKINDNIRSMGRIAWHLIQTLSDMTSKCGLSTIDELEGKPVPSDLDEIINLYRYQAEKLLNAVKANWKDYQLTDKIDVYGESWSKGFLLRSIITHEVHHRGQLTVVMRYHGIKVPGIYGPAKEEWANYKMPAME